MKVDLTIEEIDDLEEELHFIIEVCNDLLTDGDQDDPDRDIDLKRIRIAKQILDKLELI